MDFVLIALLLVASYMFQTGMAVGYMNSLATMWISTTPEQGDYALCVLRAPALTAECSGTTVFFNNTIPPAGISFWALSAGGYFSCGLQYGTQFPVCWGQAEDSGYKIGGEVPKEYQNVAYSDLNSGGWHACGVRNDSHLVNCWGLNLQNQSQPPAAQEFVSVTAGDTFTCGLTRSTSQVICWGNTTRGTINIPQVPGAKFENIYAGRLHVCGVEKSSRRTICWGDNRSKQSEPPKDVKFKAMACGLYHSCGLREDTHEAVCWGNNNYTQTDAPSGVPFASIAAGDWYTCGVTMEAGRVQCWGSLRQNISAYKTSKGLCQQKSCSSGQYSDTLLGQCPSLRDNVCLDCSRGSCRNGSVVSTPCSLTSDRVCSLPKENVAGFSRTKFPTGIVIGSILAGVIIVVIGTIAWHQRQSARHGNTSKLLLFTSSQIQEATKNYSEEMVIGKGTYGLVYKGQLPNGKIIAIKKAQAPDRVASFDKELQLLVTIHHMHLLNLVGYCKADWLLVFNFMENGSLYDCLFKKVTTELSWWLRLRIALQAARGLEYLHHYSSPRIIHRDMKSSNILIDGNWNAYVSDFGLSVFGPAGSAATHMSNVTVAGTPGYIDPEYFHTLQLTSKSDVYSFGVVLLELLTRQQAVRAYPSQGLVQWTSEMLELQENGLLDQTLPVSDFKVLEVLEQAVLLALKCTMPMSKDRPDMRFVTKALEDLLQDLPKDNEYMIMSAESSADIDEGGDSIGTVTSSLKPR